MSQQVSEICVVFQHECKLTSVNVYKFSYTLHGSLFIRSFSHQTFIGPLGTALGTAYTTHPHAFYGIYVEETGIRNIKKCIITILINAMKKNVVPFVK